MAMELLDSNIEELFNKQHKKFSLMTILLIVDQMLSRLKSIHERGIIHRDIKPENFIIKNNSKVDQRQIIYLVDFGLSKQFIDPNTRQHIQLQQKQHFIGTAGYSSLNSHRLQEQSRRDDLEGVANILVYLAKGKLPWQGIQGGKDKLEKYNLITEKKANTSIEDLCYQLPIEFALFYTYCRGLEFKQDPDYGYLKRLLRDLICRESFNQAICFDWHVQPDPKSPTQTIPHSSSEKAPQFGRVGRRGTVVSIQKEQGKLEGQLVLPRGAITLHSSQSRNLKDGNSNGSPILKRSNFL